MMASLTRGGILPSIVHGTYDDLVTFAAVTAQEKSADQKIGAEIGSVSDGGVPACPRRLRPACHPEPRAGLGSREAVGINRETRRGGSCKSGEYSRAPGWRQPSR